MNAKKEELERRANETVELQIEINNLKRNLEREEMRNKELLEEYNKYKK